MTKKQCITTTIISAILTGVFLYWVFYFPHELAKVMFWALSTVVVFGLSIC